MMGAFAECSYVLGTVPSALICIILLYVDSVIIPILYLRKF